MSPMSGLTYFNGVSSYEKISHRSRNTTPTGEYDTAWRTLSFVHVTEQMPGLGVVA